VTPQPWAARASIPRSGVDDADLNYPTQSAYAADPEPAPDTGTGRQRLSPPVIWAIVVVLLAMLGTGLYLIFNSGNEQAGTPSNVPAGSSSPTPTPAATTPPDTATTEPATPTAAPTTAAPTQPAPTTVPATPNQVTVPNLLGQSRADAIRELSGRGLVPSVQTTVRADIPPETVIETKPGPGSVLTRGSRVTVVVAVAPAKSSPPASQAPSLAPGDGSQGGDGAVGR
jgi:hypothetical protein